MTLKLLLKRRALKITASLYNNIGLKLGSLFLAAILWITITGQGIDDRILRDVPYQIRNIPENLIMTDKGIGVLDLYIRGPRSMLPAIRAEDCSVVLQLAHDTAIGEIILEVTHANISIPYPNQISLLQISPSTITITLDEITTKNVHIQPLLRGSPHPDYQLGKWRVDPEEAELEGPRSYLESLETIYSEPIDISNQSMSFNERVSLKPSTPLITVLRPARASARIEILERIVERSFPEFEISAVPENTDSRFSIEPQVITLTITGPATTLNRLRPAELRLVVDWTDLPPGKHELTPVLVTDHNRFLDVSIDPESVFVFIPKPSTDSSIDIIIPLD